MNLKLIGRILAGVGGVGVMVGGGMGLGVWQYVIGAPFIVVGIVLMCSAKKRLS